MGIAASGQRSLQVLNASDTVQITLEVRLVDSGYQLCASASIARPRIGLSKNTALEIVTKTNSGPGFSRRADVPSVPDLVPAMAIIQVRGWTTCTRTKRIGKQLHQDRWRFPRPLDVIKKIPVMTNAPPITVPLDRYGRDSVDMVVTNTHSEIPKRIISAPMVLRVNAVLFNLSSRISPSYLHPREFELPISKGRN